MIGGTLKASDLRPKRSLVVLTGAKRALGTTTAPASSKHSIADPMAVSNWKTAGVLESLGFTVFLFLMRGRCSTPFEAPRVACSKMKFFAACTFLQACLVATEGTSTGDKDHVKVFREDPQTFIICSTSLRIVLLFLGSRLAQLYD